VAEVEVEEHHREVAAQHVQHGEGGEGDVVDDLLFVMQHCRLYSTQYVHYCSLGPNGGEINGKDNPRPRYCNKLCPVSPCAISNSTLVEPSS